MLKKIINYLLLCSFILYSCAIPATTNAQEGFITASVSNGIITDPYTTLNMKIYPEPEEEFNEEAYLLAFAGVRNAVIAGTMPSGLHHYTYAGKTEGRLQNNDYINALREVKAGYNEAAYLQAFPDVKTAVINKVYALGYNHYLVKGKAEGWLNKSVYLNARSALKVFNEDAYLLAYPDIKGFIKNKTFLNGYAHYLQLGKIEGRLSTIRYSDSLNAVNQGLNEQAYLLAFPETNPDSVLYDFMSKCIYQSCLSKTEYKNAKNALKDGFSEQVYLLAFPSIKNAVIAGTMPSGLHHYTYAGKTEGRLTFPEYLYAKEAINNGFNEDAYLKAFPDVTALVNSKLVLNALTHYTFTGKYENRLTKPNYLFLKQMYEEGFNEEAYLLAFPDVKLWLCQFPLNTAYEHYLFYGKKERRLQMTIYSQAKVAISELFNESAYLLAFPGVKSSVISGAIPSALHHYTYAGKAEGRLFKPEYNYEITELTPGQEKQVEFSGKVQNFSISVTAGKVYKFSLQSWWGDDQDAYLNLYGPDGKFITKNDDSDNLDSEIFYQANITGKCKLVASTFTFASGKGLPKGTFGITAVETQSVNERKYNRVIVNPSFKFGRVLILGNSITYAPPRTNWGGLWGMAASSVNNDYVHILDNNIKTFTAGMSSDYQLKVKNLVSFEQNFTNFDYNQLKPYLDFLPDIIIIELGDNISSSRVLSENLELHYSKLLKTFSEAPRLIQPKIFCISTWGHNSTVDNAILNAVNLSNQGNNITYVDINQLSRDKVNQVGSENSNITDAGIAWHPGDKGMKALAGVIFKNIKEKLVY